MVTTLRAINLDASECQNQLQLKLSFSDGNVATGIINGDYTFPRNFRPV